VANGKPEAFAREAAKPQSDLIAGKGTRELLENAKGAELRRDFS